MESFYKWLDLRGRNPRVLVPSEDEDLLVYVFDEKHVAVVDTYHDNVLILSSDIPVSEWEELLKLVAKVMSFDKNK